MSEDLTPETTTEQPLADRGSNRSQRPGSAENRGASGLRVDQTMAQVVLPYAPTLVLSPAIVARALPLTPACVAPETHSPWLPPSMTGGGVHAPLLSLASNQTL